MPAIPTNSLRVESLTVRAVRDARRAKADRRLSRRLGASILGHDCDRFLWLSFRWAIEPDDFDGRMLRLFETGHREEARIVDDLKAAGVQIEPLDPSTGQQWEQTFICGHGVAKLDGIIFSGLPDAPTKIHTFEAKTHNRKSFAKFLEVGVEKSKPPHFAQVQIGMEVFGIDDALYFAVNKDDDDEDVERIKRDPAKAGRLLARADRVVRAKTPPAKFSEDPATFVCAFCAGRSLCHGDGGPPRNCRTCLHSTPVVTGGPMCAGDGEWHCERFDRRITNDQAPVGCPHHLFIPDLVPGEVVDADEAAERVTYQMRDGSVWIDGVEIVHNERGAAQ